MFYNDEVLDDVCSKCGKKLKPGSLVCMNCGTPSYKNFKPQRGNILWIFPGMIFPPVGIILGILWNEKRHRDSIYILIGAIVPIAITLLGFFLFGIYTIFDIIFS